MSCLQAHPAYLVFGGRNTQIGVANTPSILHIKLLITIRQTGKGDAMRRRFPFVGKEREVSFMRAKIIAEATATRKTCVLPKATLDLLLY